MPVLETCSPVSTAVSPCPGCQNPLHLTSRLHGRLVRCRSCRGVLAVVAGSEQRHTAEDPAAHDSPHPDAATPCPNCQSALYLTPELHGRFVQCRSCRSVLAVLWVAVHSQSVADLADAPVAAWDTARNPTGLATPAAPPRNGKRRAGPPTQPRLSAALSQPQRPPADSESVRPPETRVVAAEEDRTEAGREPDSLSEPEVLSDEEAFDFLADLDSREEAKRRRRGPDALRIPTRLQAAGGAASGNSSTDPVHPPGNGKAAQQGRGSNGAAKDRRPQRLTRDAGDAAARVLSRRPFAARLKKGRPPGSGTTARTRRPRPRSRRRPSGRRRMAARGKKMSRKAGRDARAKPRRYRRSGPRWALPLGPTGKTRGRRPRATGGHVHLVTTLSPRWPKAGAGRGG